VLANLTLALPPHPNPTPKVLATPLVGCRQQGSSVGFAYARLRCGESLSSSEGVNFMATDPVSGQRMWTELGHGSKVYPNPHPNPTLTLTLTPTPINPSPNP